MLFTYESNKTKNDKQNSYDISLLKLVLEKTVAKYGSYKLVKAPYMNASRILKYMELNKLENFIVKRSYSSKLLEKLDYIPFPIERGVVGYRVFFISPNAKEKISYVKTLDELKKFTMGQGLGWLDVSILEKNGFKVREGSSYQGLFRMVAANRFDLFPRGINQIYNEYEKQKNIKNLFIEKKISLYYPLPKFFFTHKSNKKALKRLDEGLTLAYEDGSFNKLWKRFYAKSLEFANLKNRKILKIENPFLKDIDPSYKKYIYQVEEE